MDNYDPNWTTAISQFGDGEKFTIGERLCVERFHPRVQSTAHTHGHVEMNFIEHGRMRYDFGGQDIWIEPGEFCLFWAGRPHQATRIERIGSEQPILSFCFMPILSFLSLQNILSLQRSVLLGGFIKMDFRNLSDRVFLNWREDVQSGDHERAECMKAELAAGLRRAILEKRVTALDISSRHQKHTKLSDKKMGYVVGMLEHVVANFTEPTVVSNAAKSVGLNRNYASNLFRASMGMTLRDFVNETRMSAAYRLVMTTDLPVTSIQFDVGFRSASQCYVRFKKRFGVLPAELRR